MKILVKNSFNNDHKKYVENLAEFCSRILFPEFSSNPNYKILVRFVYKLDGDFEADASYYGQRINPTKCVIRISSKLKLYRMTKVFMHEMAHVKQFFKGELVNLGTKSNFGYIWKQDLYNITDDESYWLFPWEIDACGYEVGLYNTFVLKYELPIRLLHLDYSAINDKIEEIV